MDVVALAELASPLGCLASNPLWAQLEVPRVNTDSRSIQPGDLFFALTGERHDGHAFVRQALAAGAVAAVVSRPVDVEPEHAGRLMQVDDPLAALHRLATWHRGRLRGTVIGITGANGKTTTKNLLHHVLTSRLVGQASQKSFNNHIGVPLTILSAKPDDDFLIVEIGTNHPGEVAQLARIARADVAVVTSLAESHLEGLGDLAGVAREELSQLACRTPGVAAFVHGDHPMLRGMAANFAGPIVFFGEGRGCQIRVDRVETSEAGVAFELDSSLRPHACAFLNARGQLPMPGRHNAINAAAVWGVASFMGLRDEHIAERMATFTPATGRSNWMRLAGVLLLDDCYNANPGSMRAALQMLAELRPGPGGRRILVSGDMLELGVHAKRLHADLGAQAAVQHVDLLFAVGRYAADVCSAFCPATRGRPAGCCTFATATDAAARVPALLRPGDIVLVKGSRGIRLEAVCQAIQAHLSAPLAACA